MAKDNIGKLIGKLVLKYAKEDEKHSTQNAQLKMYHKYHFKILK